MVRYLSLGILVILLIFERPVLADVHFAGFGHISEPAAADTRGPVQTEKASLANLAPVLLPFFNNGPLFSPPGTYVDDGPE